MASKQREYFLVVNLPLVLLLLQLTILNCTPATTPKTTEVKTKYPQAVPFIKAPEKLSHELIGSAKTRETVRIGMLGLIGTGGNISRLGEY